MTTAPGFQWRRPEFWTVVTGVILAVLALLLILPILRVLSLPGAGLVMQVGLNAKTMAALGTVR